MKHRVRWPLAQSTARVLELVTTLDSSLFGPAGPAHIGPYRALGKQKLRKIGTAEVADHRIIAQPGTDPELLARQTAQLSDRALTQHIGDQFGGRGSEGVGHP
eukprot:5063716-Pyramimonas_sp.AAC.1